MTETLPDENKALIQRFFDQVVNQRDVDSLSSFVSRADGGGTCGGTRFADLVTNPALRGGRFGPSAAGGPAKEEPVDVDAWQEFTKHVLEAFPDLRVKIDWIVAEGDTVVVRWSGRPTHRGEFLSTPPTGRKVRLSSVDVFTVEDGKIRSVRAHPDTARVLDSMGHLPRTQLVTTLVQDEPDDDD
jgi:predicted ester cyclase